ncbi:MAG: hypothetical protein H7144_08980 [Burkholderiales bacterium]|nr:hypothetical protein [Phycisphaerae bacterium]
MTPAESTNYRTEKVLRPGMTTLAVDAAGARVVLKRLPDDCVWRGQLHPSVKQRLERLRELPSTAFAQLIGVEQHAEGMVIVSRYVEGLKLDEVPIEGKPAVLDELWRVTTSVHRLGMVHGAISAGNVIIDKAGAVHLIDPSPLLHDDPAIDLAALEKLGWAPITESVVVAPGIEDRHRRRRSLISAVALTLAAICVAWATVVYLSE